MRRRINGSVSKKAAAALSLALAFAMPAGVYADEAADVMNEAEAEVQAEVQADAQANDIAPEAAQTQEEAQISTYSNSPEIAVSDTSGNGTQFDVGLTGFTLPSQNASVTAAVWSDENGQDDIIWHKMTASSDGSFHASVKPSAHKSSGAYNAHIYCDNGGTLEFISGVSFTVDGGSCSGIVIADTNQSAGTCTVKIEGLSCASGVSRVQIPVWSKADQSDIVWYDAQAGSDGSYYANVNIANHNNNSGIYNVHAYVTSGNGHLTFLGETTVEFSEKPASVSVTKTGEGKYALHAEGFSVRGTVLNAYFAVWSTANGQDDLKWWPASYNLGDGTMDLSFDAGNLKDKGEVNVHAYLEISGSGMKYLGETTFDHSDPSNSSDSVSPGEYLTASYDQTKGTFTLTIDGSKLNSSIKSVVVPVWSKEDQSDIVWYTAQKNQAGNYVADSSIASHNYNTGVYNADAYGIDGNGKYVFLEGEKMDFSVKQGTVTASTADELTYNIEYSSLTVPAGAANVQFAVWSDEGGQDDIIWHNASGTNGGKYSASVKVTDHKSSKGVYNAHAYATLKNGQLVFLGETTFTVNASAGASITVSNINEQAGTFDVNIQLTDVSGAVGSVEVPIWTKADQSDIYWYKAENLGNNLFKVTVDIRNHSNNTGVFNIHAYCVFANRIESFLTAAAQSFSTDAELMISNPTGSGTRRVTYVNGSVSSVVFAVWSDVNGQDDIKWYNAASDGNGRFYCDIDIDNHNGNGTYNVHVYTGAVDQFLGETTFGMVDYVEWAISAASDDSIGYSQDYRCMNPDVDCSSFVYYALYNNGFSGSLTSYPFYTGTQVSYMQRCGFEVMNFTSEEDLKPGDVLWYRNGSAGHTEIYIGNGLMVGAHDSVVNGIDYSEGGDQTGQEVSVKRFSDPGWAKVLRIYD
jgi:hypothetical protein